VIQIETKKHGGEAKEKNFGKKFHFSTILLIV